MRKLLLVSVVLSLCVAIGPLGVAGPAPCATENGDVNGDGGRDLSDAIYHLSHLFQGGPAPALFCAAAGTGENCAEENGDTNGDGGTDLSDVIYLLTWLFQGGSAPVPKCPEVIAGDPVRLPKTSTTPPTCYDESVPPVEILCTDATCRGQDGFYDKTGCLNDPRFVDNGDETVTDTCTGLMWQKESGNGGAGFSWCDALAYCEGLTFPAGGHDDWRLPSIRELESIVDYRRPPAFDTTVFPNHSNAHWSSTSVTGSGADAWYVDFSGGQVKGNSGKHNGNRVRAVRGLSDLPKTGQTECYDENGNTVDCTTGDCNVSGDPAIGQDGFYATGCSNSPRFTDNGDTVTDACTGLMWQKSLGNGGTTFSWCGALDYCEGLNFAGQTDWRLPNPRELHSLTDYGRQGTALDPLLGAAVGRRSWASTSQILLATHAWSGYFAADGQNDVQAGATDTLTKDSSLPVRAVRCEGPGSCAEVSCDDNLDNDADGLTDCADSDCDSSGVCPEAICDDAVDNDVDGVTDCADTDCDSSGVCETNCGDNVDDDVDGFTDCDDTDCATATICNVNPSLLPDTSTTQVQCWDDSVPAVEIPCADATCPGQDGFYTNACPNGPTRFVDNGNETVTDTCTGLVWQKTSAGGFPWCDALTFCEGLALAGQNDWRLPSIRELESLLDYARPPAFDPVFVGPNSAHWSSTSVADPGPGAFAWYVNFSGGDVSGSGKNNANQVRAVRGVSGLPESGQTLCYDAAGAVIPCADTGACPGQDGFYATGCSNTPRFIDNLNDTVTDTCTGLMWQKNTGNGETALAWCGALAYCEGLSLASRSDWRLPNARELHSLLDYGSRGPALDPLFSAVVGQGSWASTSQTGFARNAWYFGLDIGSPFEGGASSTSSKQTLLHVRAIRDAP